LDVVSQIGGFTSVRVACDEGEIGVGVFGIGEYFEPPPLYFCLQVGPVGFRGVAIYDDIGCGVRVVG
jgi:hypothetical protein